MNPEPEKLRFKAESVKVKVYGKPVLILSQLEIVGSGN
jgi:hypothetical protein